MKRRLTILPALLLAAVSSLAAPVQPGHKKTLPDNDGNIITAEQFGDEFLSWWQTEDGTRYTLADDGKTFAKADFSAMQAHARAMRAPLAKSGIGGDHITYTGKKKGLIILVQFADRQFKPEHGRDYYKTIANGEGFTSDEGYIGSVHDYYMAQSNGLFDLTFDVVGPVTTANGYAYYGANKGSSKDVKIGELVREVSDAAAPGLDLSLYDWDGDGIADQVFYLYAGVGENASDDPNTIWAHMYYMHNRGGALSYPTGKIDRYACASELMGIKDKDGKYTDQTRLSGIGTLCHEFSHCLGFPDTYDTNGQKLYGMGYYDLLAYGNYLGNGFTPPNFTAWERIYAGWTEPIELDRAATVKAMQSATEYGRPFIMYNDANHNEYYLLENRQKTGWDRSLYGTGLMITHVDYEKKRWTDNKVNATGQDHQRMTLIHADNDELDNQLSSVRGDLYPYTSKDGLTHNDELTDTSTPAATLWNSHDKSIGTTYMGKPITAITRNDDGTVSFLVMGGDDSNTPDNADPTGITALKPHRRTAESGIYTLDGRRMNGTLDTLPKGVYVTGGRKVMK